VQDRRTGCGHQQARDSRGTEDNRHLEFLTDQIPNGAASVGHESFSASSQ
jgi:hypothetical protein